MDGLPPLHQCELCGRDILRVEKNVYYKVEGWTRSTVKGRLDAGHVSMLKAVGGVACQTCIEITAGRHHEPETLF
jgi:hypothetical protein